MGGFIMAFFEEIGKKISKSGQEAAQKAKNMAETVRLNGLISDEEKRIKSAYTQIGKLYYETFGDNPEPCFGQLITDIGDAEKNIKKHTEQIRRVKGIAVCDNCGGETSNTAPFCSACGSPVTQATPPSSNVCINCSAVLTEDQIFCTGCGTKVEKLPVQAQEDAAQPGLLSCANCQQELTAGVAFCLNCGTKVN